MTNLLKLLLPGDRIPLAEQHRAQIITSRVRVVAWMFALLTPAWILVDALTYEWPLWGYLAALRIGAALCFAMIVIWGVETRDIWRARRMLLALMLIPMTFFIISNPLMARFEIHGVAEAVSMGYIFLPFVMMAGLSVFPITALEGLLFVLSILTVTAILPLVTEHLILVPFNSYLGAIWLLALIGVVATFSGMSQLHFMYQLVKQSSHDPLTQAYTRRAGMEMLELHFHQALRNNAPLAIAFVDIDHFKLINDRYGHEEGDNALRAAAENIRRTLRGSDLVIRWGGEEFVVIMPHTEYANATIPLQRLQERGLGERPDESRLTASIGLAERIQDESSDFRHLVALADQRMYIAKQQGRDRIITEGGERPPTGSRAEAFHQPSPLPTTSKAL